MANVLMISPVLPRSFWSFQQNIQAMGRKALLPPLGLLTVAAMLPDGWTPRVADLNVRPVTEEDWQWADLVMLSGMLVQREGMLSLAAEAKRRGKTVIAGGPCATASPEEMLGAGCDYVVSGEGEEIMGELSRAVEEKAPSGVLRAEGKPDLELVPLPRYDLVECRVYDAMPVQTSRGCPFACEFCDIINLFGQTPRYKPAFKVLAELQAIFDLGYRGMVFFTDDNFIGNPKRAEELLNALIPWNRERGEPFWFITQASVNLGSRPDLVDLMTQANFGFVFLGIESPDEDVLARASKTQNIRHPLLDSIRAVNAGGLSVIGSFILGFDQEKPGADKRIQAFIDAAGLPLAMINVLQAVPGTRLWDRMKSEGRLREGPVGDLATGVMNFEPTRPMKQILAEQISLWDTCYDIGNYMDRALRATLEMRPSRPAPKQDGPAGQRPEAPPASGRTEAIPPPSAIRQLAFLGGLIWSHGIASRHRARFWKNLAVVRRENPSRLKRYLMLLAMGKDILDFTGVVRERASPALR